MQFSFTLAFALAALPSTLLWLFFWRRRVAEPEPQCVTFQLFFFGIFAALPLLALRDIFQSLPATNFFAMLASPVALIIVFALLEEVLKALALIGGVEANRKRFDKWEDGFEFAAVVALGFAFAENAMYFLTQYFAGGLSGQFWYVYLFRSLGTMLGHVLFSGAFGYFYALAYLELPKSKHAKPLANALRNFFAAFGALPRVLLGQRKKVASTGVILFVGLLVAVFLHAGFNALLTFTALEQSLAWLTVPLLAAGVGGYVWLLRR